MFQHSYTREDKLADKALLDKVDEGYHETMRERYVSQIEASLQARIKELEGDNRALSVANSVVVTSEQASKTKIGKLQKANDLLEGRDTTNREHYDAEIKKLQEKNETLTKEISSHDTATQSKDVEVDKLKEQNGGLAQEKQSKDAVISELKKREVDHIATISTLREQAEVEKRARMADATEFTKEKSKLQGQVSSLSEELKAAKEIIAASKAPLPPAPLPTPPSSVQSGPFSSSSFQWTGQQSNGYPSPPMSSGQGSSVSN